MSEEPDNDDRELRRLRNEVAAQQRDIHDLDDREHLQETLIAACARRSLRATGISPRCTSGSRRPSMSWRTCARPDGVRHDRALLR
jgi:hypothetical protein